MNITDTLKQLATADPILESEMQQQRSLVPLGDRVRDKSTVSLEFLTEWDRGRKCYRSHVGWEVLTNGGRSRAYSWTFPSTVPFVHTEQSGRFSRKALATAHQNAQTMLAGLAQENPDAFAHLFELEYSALDNRGELPA